MRLRSRRHWESSDPGETIPAVRLAEAAVLVARLHGGDRTEAELVRRWLRVDATNAAAFALTTEIWDESQKLCCMAALSSLPDSYNQYEREALKVVHDWDEAWKTKDPEKIAQYMTEDVIIRDPSVQKESGTGRKKFISAYKKLMTGINYYEVTSRYAAGDALQTVVVEKRRDHVTMNGKEQILNFVGYFRVMNGKIVEWADVAIVRSPSMDGLPPDGAPEVFVKL